MSEQDLHEPAPDPAPERHPAGPAVAVVADRPGPRRLPLLLGLLVVVAALSVAVVALALRARDAGAVKAYYAPTSAPVQAARTASRVLFSYDYRHLDADFAAGRALATGSFATAYGDTTQKVVKQVAAQYRAVVTADAVVAGISSAAPGRVVAIVFVNQSTTSTRVTGPQQDLSRVRMTLEQHGGRWLVSKVEAL